ncbi:hypothetical protein B0H19DRAFT_1273158 [Mycena capillaripes]|nr:hypothetical protein B0H19DRAFT_1273158 [Mycena capillaripes]
MSVETTHLFRSADLRSIENQVECLIAAAEANIERLTEQIRELNCARERERHTLSTLRMRLLPIGKLPTELLVEIFQLAVHTPVQQLWKAWNWMARSWSNDNEDSRAALLKVLYLSQVLSYWRLIVQDSQQLWAQAVVDISLGRNLTDQYLDGLEILLARSASLPISVSLTLIPRSSRNPSTFPESSETLARIMSPTAGRWKNLAINFDSFFRFNDLHHTAFTSLECLFIGDFSKQSDPVTAFQSCARLRNFTFKSSPWESKIHLFHLPWSQLTHLEAHDTSLGGCRTTLLQCSNIVWAKFQTSYRWDLSSQATDSPVINLPFLDRLILTFSGLPDPAEINGVEAFLMPLALPSLKTVK